MAPVQFRYARDIFPTFQAVGVSTPPFPRTGSGCPALFFIFGGGSVTPVPFFFSQGKLRFRFRCLFHSAGGKGRLAFGLRNKSAKTLQHSFFFSCGQAAKAVFSLSLLSGAGGLITKELQRFLEMVMFESKCVFFFFSFGIASKVHGTFSSFPFFGGRGWLFTTFSLGTRPQNSFFLSLTFPPPLFSAP